MHVKGSLVWFWERNSEESGNITGVKVTKVHPIEGVSTEINFTSEIRGEGRIPNFENLASSIGKNECNSTSQLMVNTR